MQKTLANRVDPDQMLQNMSPITGNLSSGLCNHVRLKLAFSVTKASYSVEILDLRSIGIILSCKQQGH